MVKKEKATGSRTNLAESPTLKHLSEGGGLDSAIVGSSITKRIESLETGDKNSRKKRIKDHLVKE
jgi:hypothetical protein